MKTTMIDQEKQRLIKKFKTLLGKAKIDRNAELAMLSGYGVESCKDMNAYELLEICNKLQLLASPELEELDRLRKRLLASVFGWRKAMGCTSTLSEVKGIACRAAKVENFNHISKEKLRSLYSAFNKKNTDLKMVSVMTEELINKQISQN